MPLTLQVARQARLMKRAPLLFRKFDFKVNTYDKEGQPPLNMPTSQDGSAEETQTDKMQKFCWSNPSPQKTIKCLFSAGRFIE
ncbi:MAG: hypothetical protein NPIRA06_08130 [Nitrospirales bacterium]|nr:MAG: hypothetical protein NPIRA06_08130 [Nitrospirales bacterium]